MLNCFIKKNINAVKYIVKYINVKNFCLKTCN